MDMTGDFADLLVYGVDTEFWLTAPCIAELVCTVNDRKYWAGAIIKTYFDLRTLEKNGYVERGQGITEDAPPRFRLTPKGVEEAVKVRSRLPGLERRALAAQIGAFGSALNVHFG